uniref:MFS domain-containing protein n=1 Tax=Globodera pallida TaxID=36090 RepID=A0A183CEE8_GLOPA
MAVLCASLNSFHLLVILTWQFMILFATQMLFGIFTTFTPKWRCLTPLDRNNSFASPPFGKDCAVYERCAADQIEFEAIPFASAAVDFQWICGTGAYTKALYSQIQFFGVLLGTVVLAPLSDSFGRKPIGLITFFFGLLSLALSALSPNWQWLLFGRFAVSFLMGGSLVVVATFTMEIMPPEHRMILRTFCNWGISRLILTFLCYAFPDWRSASVASALVSVPGLLIIAFLLPESPIWLHSQNRLDEMLQSEQQIARLAGVEHTPVKRRAPTSEKKAANFWALVRDRTLFCRLLVLWMMWFTSSMSSYSVDLNSSNLSGDLFVNQLLLSIPVILSKLMLLVLDTYMPRFSRRNLHHFSQMIVIFCFILLTVLVLLKYDGIWILFVNLFGVIFLEFTWDANVLSAVESMPTALRSSAVGSCSCIARVGGLFAPLLVFFNEHWGASAYLAVALLGSANLLVSWLWLVDTKGVDLDAIDLDGESDGSDGEGQERNKSWAKIADGQKEKEKFLTEA